MSEATSIDTSLETTSRQIMYLVSNKGESFSDSLLKVKECGDVSAATAVDLLESMTDPDAALKLPPKSPFWVLVAMVRACADPKQSIATMSPRFIQLHKAFRQQVIAYILSLKNTMAYSAVLILLGLLVSNLYRSKVLPQFVATFTQQDSELPAFTLFMLDVGLPIVFLLLVAAGVFVLALFWTIKAVINSANQFTPVKSWLANTVVVRPITQAVNDYLLICYAYILAGGLSATDSVLTEATKFMTESSRQSPTKMFSSQQRDLLKLSQSLETLEFELEHQLDQASENLGRQLVRFRTGINIGFQVAIFFLIGAMVVSFYGPIFIFGNLF